MPSRGLAHLNARGESFSHIWVDVAQHRFSSADGPGAFVDRVMGVETDQQEFAGVGAAAVGPVVEMVDLTVGGGPIAAGEDAAAVAGDDEPAQAGGSGSGAAGGVEDL